MKYHHSIVVGGWHALRLVLAQMYTRLIDLPHPGFLHKYLPPLPKA